MRQACTHVAHAQAACIPSGDHDGLFLLFFKVLTWVCLVCAAQGVKIDGLWEKA
ncbi:hypothetical protein A11S_261 [Micavibrio aeruginosavorus EPB]|uniref:Uncharacterized protein n=1 Tax=Micavibrio aeruginosavorus EPB TaxID=349215 RepID=M4VCJ0_9BACT|nr:hypothetical protein A11S_261 [Micavibrio aeruginosavorus EPB]